VTPIEEVFAGSSFAYATHTFDLVDIEGETIALYMTQVEDADLNKAKIDVVVAISMVTGDIVPTLAGKPYFSIWDELGTTSTIPSDSVHMVRDELYLTQFLANPSRRGVSAL